jgi:RecJ-like exonuclease
MKTELKTQKETLETITKSLEDQAKIIDELVESRASPSRHEADSDGTSQDGAVQVHPLNPFSS